jgi:thiamine-phosphate pyrophosphorylase
MKLDPFYLIVDSADWIERLVPLGVRLVQLRIKDQPQWIVRSEIRRAKEFCGGFDCQLIINDYWQAAIEEDCDYIHLGQEDLAGADLAAIKAASIKLGISTHDETELTTALAAAPDYIALGPIYPTKLKQMKWGPQGLSRITQWKAQIADVPLVAIGGLTIDPLDGVFGAGADSAAVVTDITLHDDPEARTLAWIAKTAPWR